MTARHQSLVARLAAAAALATLVGCGGGEKDPCSENPFSPSCTNPTPLQYVSVSGNFAVAAVGGTTQLRANANFGTGAQDITTQATWQSSNESVASVSSGGLVTARGAGLALITARYQDTTGFGGVAVATVVDFTGIWGGTSTNPTGDITFDLRHGAETVTGTSSVLGGGRTYTGAVTGTVSGSTLVLAGSASDSAGRLAYHWNDERCALETASRMKCLNPMTDAAGSFWLMEVTFVRQ